MDIGTIILVEGELSLVSTDFYLEKFYSVVVLWSSIVDSLFVDTILTT